MKNLNFYLRENCFSFPKTLRLLDRKQFLNVSKYGKSVSGKYLSICFIKKPSLKLGITVTRKFGGAVARNHFKRLVRESFRHIQHLFPEHFYVNVRPTSPASHLATQTEIQAELLDLCKKIT